MNVTLRSTLASLLILAFARGSAQAIEVLGTGAGALVGSDLTDVGDDGIDRSTYRMDKRFVDCRWRGRADDDGRRETCDCRAG